MRLHRIGKTEKTDKWGENDKLIIVGNRGGRVTKHKMDNLLLAVCTCVWEKRLMGRKGDSIINH